MSDKTMESLLHISHTERSVGSYPTGPAGDGSAHFFFKENVVDSSLTE